MEISKLKMDVLECKNGRIKMDKNKKNHTLSIEAIRVIDHPNTA